MNQPKGRNKFVSSPAHGMYPNNGKPWDESEKHILSRFRNEGADAIAAMLGRSPMAIRVMASKMHVSLRVKPGELCPVCGKYRIRDHTAAARHGMCPACWTKELIRLREEAAEQKRLDRAYQAAKKRAQRAGGRK